MMGNGALGLGQNDFWGSFAAKDAARDALNIRVLEEGWRGLIADAPTSVALESRKSVPILAYFVRDIRDDVHIDVDRQLLIVGSDHATHQVRVTRALWSAKRLARKGPPPAADPGPGAMTSFFEIDAAARLGLEGHPGRWTFMLLLREWRSELLEVEFGPPPGGFHDAAAAQLIAERRHASPPPPSEIWPALPERRVGVSSSYGRSYPRYADKAQAPDVPSEPGICIEVDRAVVSNERCMLRGSFRLPVLPREQVSPRLYDTGGGTSERRMPDVGDERAKAVVPISVILTGSQNPGPFIITLQLPAYELDTSGRALGRFEIDLFELADMPRAATTYFLHALHGPHAVGPLPIGVVSPAMIG
jgi:hypothetical protein